MSAPNTNLDKEAERHRGPLRGMFAVVLFALVMFAGLWFFISNRGGGPEGAEAQVDDRTGVVEATANDGPVTSDHATPDAPRAEEGDPAAVAVPAETVTAPEVGGGNVADSDPGESQAAEPLDPSDEEGPGDTAGDNAEVPEEGVAEPAAN